MSIQRHSYSASEILQNIRHFFHEININAYGSVYFLSLMKTGILGRMLWMRGIYFFTIVSPKRCLAQRKHSVCMYWLNERTIVKIKKNRKNVYVPNAGLKSLEQSVVYAKYLICEFIKYFVCKTWCPLLETLKSRRPRLSPYYKTGDARSRGRGISKNKGVSRGSWSVYQR